MRSCLPGFAICPHGSSCKVNEISVDHSYTCVPKSNLNEGDVCDLDFTDFCGPALKCGFENENSVKTVCNKVRKREKESCTKFVETHFDKTKCNYNDAIETDEKVLNEVYKHIEICADELDCIYHDKTGGNHSLGKCVQTSKLHIFFLHIHQR